MYDHLPRIALSVRQPWAWAIIHGGKDIENRTAAAVRHGMEPKSICIHASKGMTRDEYESASDFMETIGVDCPNPNQLDRGCIVGIATVSEIVKEHDSPWFFGPRGLVLANKIGVVPIPAKGALGYFKWKESGAIEEPKPWMTAWPGSAPKTKSQQAPGLPLFNFA